MLTPTELRLPATSCTWDPKVLFSSISLPDCSVFLSLCWGETLEPLTFPLNSWTSLLGQGTDYFAVYSRIESCDEAREAGRAMSRAEKLRWPGVCNNSKGTADISSWLRRGRCNPSWPASYRYHLGCLLCARYHARYVYTISSLMLLVSLPQVHQDLWTPHRDQVTFL